MQKTIQLIKEKNPLVLNITNAVTMDFIANGLLSLGASPIMSQAAEELEDLIPHIGSVSINIGTLDGPFIKLCQRTSEVANQLNKPIVLDPVGVGATRYRTETAHALLNNHRIAIVRGNASEIMALANKGHHTKGVDSNALSQQAIESGQMLSEEHDVAVVISGKTDVIIDHGQMVSFERGSALMPTITGTGCLLTAVVAASHAVEKDRFEAAKNATFFYALCGEIAEVHAKGPGTFRGAFLDALHSIPIQDERL